MTGLVVLATVVQTALAADTASALAHARRMIAAMYDVGGRHQLQDACDGVRLDACMSGDWSCPRFACPRGLEETRFRVMRQLDEIAPAAGHSEWLFRQRVALAIKHGDLERAGSIARECGARDAWCLMLRGLVDHLVDPGAGLSRFDSAFALLEAEPRRLPSGRYAWGGGPDARCVWLDARVLAPVRELRSAPAPCTVENELYWWLADPLWSRPGNERLLEHLARHVLIRMDIDVLRALNGSEEDDGNDAVWETLDLYDAFALVYRQGYPNSRRRLERGPGPDLVRTPPGERRRLRAPVMAVIGSTPYVRGGYGFAPDSLRLYSTLNTASSDWHVELQEDGCAAPWTEHAQRASRSDAAEEWLGRIERVDTCGTERLMTREIWRNLDHQTVVLRRGDRLELVSVARVPAELQRASSATLAAGRLDDMTTHSIVAVIDTGGVFRARGSLDLGSWIASIEVVGTDHIARARYAPAVPPLEDGFGVSAPALIDPSFGENTEVLEQALLPATELAAGTSAGLYFEIYGLAEGERPEITLSTEKISAGFFERIGRVLGLSEHSRPVQIEWSDPGADVSIAPRFLMLNASALSSGDYRIAVTVRRANGQEASSSSRLRFH